MSAPATREEFFDLVRRSEVLEGERLDSFVRTLTDSGTAIEQPQSVAQRMVHDGLLTAFQAKQILAGKWRRRFKISGKYKLLELIGAGGMGSVYLCEHIFMQRLVALKILPTDKLRDPSSLARFYREARAAGALDHPNIVRAYDVDQDGQTHFLVMEYVDGADLQKIVSKHGKMDPIRAAHYIRQAALGLQHAHEAGLVHRDIKPGNLLVDRSGTVKILDLGLARFFDAHKDNITEKYDDGATLGTADYLAPEQALHHNKVDIRADIYSLGATFFFMLTGRAPFEEGTLTQKLLWHQIRKIQSVTDYRKDVPPAMAAVVEKMLSKGPEDRYPTPQAVADALAPWTQQPIDPPPAAWMPKPMTPGARGDGPVLPITPSPRSNVARAAPSQRPINSTPSPKTMLPPDVAPKAAVSRAVEDRRPRRRKPAPNNTKMIVQIVGGSVASLAVIFGIIWLSTRKSEHKPPPDSASGLAPLTIVSRSSPAPATTSGLDVIPPERAAVYFEKKCIVEMTVVKTGKATTTVRYFLNSKTDLGAADNFTVTFTGEVFDQLKSKGMTTLDAYFLGKTIRVTGTVTRYSGKLQIQVQDADQIAFVNR